MLQIYFLRLAVVTLPPPSATTSRLICEAFHDSRRPHEMESTNVLLMMGPLSSESTLPSPSAHPTPVQMHHSKIKRAETSRGGRWLTIFLIILLVNPPLLRMTNTGPCSTGFPIGTFKSTLLMLRKLSLSEVPMTEVLEDSDGNTRLCSGAVASVVSFGCSDSPPRPSSGSIGAALSNSPNSSTLSMVSTLVRSLDSPHREP